MSLLCKMKALSHAEFRLIAMLTERPDGDRFRASVTRLCEDTPFTPERIERTAMRLMRRGIVCRVTASGHVEWIPFDA